MTQTDTERFRSENNLRLVSVFYDGMQRMLCIVVDGARVSDEVGMPGTGSPEIDAIFGGSRAIEVLPGCRRYEVRFADAIGYLVRDESYAQLDQNEDVSSVPRVQGETQFLTYMRAATFAEDVLDAPLEHWAVATLDDVVDVGTRQGAEPTITSRVLTATDVWG